MEVVLGHLLRSALSRSAGQLWAYIDPSSGSLLFQATVASLLSAALLVKGLRDRIVWVLTAGWRAKPEESATEAAEVVKIDSAIAGQPSPDKESRKAA
jgi:hypothetical protein